MGLADSPFEKPEESIMGMMIMSLGQFGDFYDTFEDSRYPEMGKVGQVDQCIVVFEFPFHLVLDALE